MTNEKLTSDFWDEWSSLSYNYRVAVARSQRADADFLLSIIKRLSYPYALSLCASYYKTYEECLIKLPTGNSIPVLINRPKRISCLSENQKAILSKLI